MTALIASGCDAIHPLSGASDAEKTVEVAMFEGGYGIDWHSKIAARYTAEHPGVRVDLWGDQRSDEIVKPRILRGDPPEIVLSVGLPIWTLVGAGKIATFDAALDGPAYGAQDNTKWRDLFIPGTLDMYTSGNSVYAVPSAFGAWGCWYNARLFREHGWEVPKTWSQFDALCTRIRAAGIEPIAFQGKYPNYAWWTFVTLVQRIGGVAAINRINAIEPGAFTHPDVVRAAGLVQDMARKHFQKGAMAMTHTESQLQFVNDKAALIFCGIWLENEQKTTTPPDFEMRCFNVPAVEGGKGNPDSFDGEGSEYLFLMADARNVDSGADFCRYMISPLNAPDLGKSIGVISPLKGATPREAVSPALQSVLDMMERSPGIFSVRLPLLLLRWNNEDLIPGMAALLGGALTPEQFCQKLDKGAQLDKKNPDLKIPPYHPLDPRQFGEPE